MFLDMVPKNHLGSGQGQADAPEDDGCEPVSADVEVAQENGARDDIDHKNCNRTEDEHHVFEHDSELFRRQSDVLVHHSVGHAEGHWLFLSRRE